MLERFAAPRERQEQQAQCDHRADGGHVIHDEVQMCEIHGTRYARRRPAVTAPVPARIDATASPRTWGPAVPAAASPRRRSVRTANSVAALATTRIILTRNGTAVPQVVGFLMNSKPSVTRLTTRPMARV